MVKINRGHSSVSPRQNNGSEMTHRKCTIQVPSSSSETQDPMRDTKLLYCVALSPVILSALPALSAAFPTQPYPEPSCLLLADSTGNCGRGSTTHPGPFPPGLTSPQQTHTLATL